MKNMNKHNNPIAILLIRFRQSCPITYGTMQLSGCCPGCFLLFLAIFWGHSFGHSSTESWHHLPSKGGAWPISFLLKRMLKFLPASKMCHGKIRPRELPSCTSGLLLLAAALLRSLEPQPIRLPPTNLATSCLHFSKHRVGYPECQPILGLSGRAFHFDWIYESYGLLPFPHKHFLLFFDPCFFA